MAEFNVNTIDVQLSKVYVLDVPVATWALCNEAVPAILAGNQCLCPTTIGDLGRTRAVTETSCISSNESIKSGGRMSYSDYTLELLFDPLDVAGQTYLKEALDNNTPLILGVEGSDRDTTLGDVGVSGTIVWTEAIVAGDTIAYPADGKIGYTVTVSPFGGYTMCPAVPGTA